ncbi:MAG: YggT family protein [bacterium]
MLPNILVILANIVNVILTVYYWLIIIRALLSWINPDPYNPAINLLYRITEPVLAPFRKIIPIGGNYGIDLSPLFAILAIYFFKSLIVQALLKLAMKLGSV